MIRGLWGLFAVLLVPNLVYGECLGPQFEHPHASSNRYAPSFSLNIPGDVQAGQVVILALDRVEDRDGDPVLVRWCADSGDLLRAQDGALRSIQWRAPAQAGVVTLNVSASDGRGRIRRQRVRVNVIAGPDDDEPDLDPDPDAGDLPDPPDEDDDLDAGVPGDGLDGGGDGVPEDDDEDDDEDDEVVVDPPAPPEPPNTAPIALAGDDVVIRCVTEDTVSVLLDGTRSFDPDGDPLTYRWVWPGGSAEGPLAEGRFPPGQHPVVLLVDDGQRTHTDRMVVGVAPDQNAPRVVEPLANRRVVERETCVGAALEWSVTGADDCDPNPEVRWRYQDAEYENPLRVESVPMGAHPVELTVTDRAGHRLERRLNVSVVDRRAPTLQGPALLETYANDVDGAWVPLRVDVIDDVCAEALTWRWTTEDGRDLGANPSFVRAFFAMGTHRVHLRVSDDVGWRSEHEIEVIIAPPRRAEPLCTDTCSPPGGSECVGAQRRRRCADLDGDGCREWSEVLECPNDRFCHLGLCVEECIPDCEIDGATRCGAEGVEHCRPVDGRGCLRWSAARACPEPMVCREGGCQHACEDECPRLGLAECTETGARRMCGHRDDDPCLEWIGPMACASGSTCMDGLCMAAPTETPAPTPVRFDRDSGLVVVPEVQSDGGCRSVTGPSNGLVGLILGVVFWMGFRGRRRRTGLSSPSRSVP